MTNLPKGSRRDNVYIEIYGDGNETVFESP